MNINTRLQTPLRTPMPPCEQLGDLPPDMLAIIHRLLRRADLHSLSLTSPNQQGLTQASKKEWSVWDEQCKKWEYIHGSKWKYGIKDSNPQYPQFYLGIPPSNERQHNKDGAKLRLFIQQRGLSDKGIENHDSTIIAMDYNPKIVDDLDPRFPGIPIRFNFNKINEKGDIQRVVIGDHRLFLTILYKCKDILENLMLKTAIWTGEDVLDLEEDRQRQIDPLTPFPGYVESEYDNQLGIKANEEKLKAIYQQIIVFIKDKIKAHPGEPPGISAPLSLGRGGNKKIKKKKQTK